MIKNIIIAVLAFICLFLILFSFIKGKEANKNLIVAKMCQQEAEKQKQIAEEQTALAIKFQSETEAKLASLMAELEACKKR